MAIALRGQSAALDAELDLLRRELQSSAAEDLSKVFSRIERQVKYLDDQRLSVRRDIGAALERWLGQLRSLSASESFSNLLKNTERRVPDAAEHLYKLSALLLEMVELQQGLLPQMAKAGADNNFALNHNDDNDVVDLEVLESRLAAEMLNLIEALNIQASGLELARQLIQRIETGVLAADLPELMSDLVRLARLSAGLEHDDFENYLLSLNEQLAYVQEFLVQSQAEENTAFAAHQQLDEKVRRDVSQLRESVKTTDDLRTLKTLVARQLESIVSTMDDYRLREKEREQGMRRRYQALLEKVEQMELEAARVKSRIEEEQIRARTDPLTGLPNRAAYNDSLESELGRWDRYATEFSIAVVDLDLFKEINDKYGHLAGDKVLRLVARVLRQSLRGSDFIARYGGEEFVVIFPSTGRTDAAAAAEKLRSAVETSPFNFRGEPVRVTASLGVAVVQAGDSAEALFARADQALYQAKDGGRNNVVICG